MSKKILRVNMNSLETKYEDLPEIYAAAGGRGLTSAIVAAEVPPKCHPLGPNNKIVFCINLSICNARDSFFNFIIIRNSFAF